MRMDLPAVVPARIANRLTEDPETGCWRWSAAHGKQTGYACVWWNGSQRSVHRVLFELLICRVPDALVLDHIVCSDKACANPHHTWPTTNAKNMVRERLERPSCKHGHTDWKVVIKPDGSTRRKCNECGRIEARERQRRKRAERAVAHDRSR